MHQCDPNGSIYVERSQQYTDPETYNQVSTLEYVLPSGALTSHHYH